MKLSILNPISSQYSGIKDFKTLSHGQQAKAVIFSALAALFTFPALGVGGVAAFRATVTKYAERNKTINEVGVAVIMKKSINTSDITNKEELDLIENDGKPSNVDIIQRRHETLELDENYRVPQDHDTSLLENGQFKTEAGELQCGETTLPFASTVRAVKQDKVVEDQLLATTIEFTIGDTVINTPFILSCDGNKNNAMSLFYKEEAPKFFKEFVQERLNQGELLDDALATKALKYVEDKVFDEWVNHPMAGKSQSTVNMLFLFPAENDSFKGAFLGRGDTRTLIFKKDGEVNRVGTTKDGETIGTFTLEPGDLIFTSSDGIWHNASPTQVGEFIRSDLNEGKTLQNTVERLVAATVTENSRDDDRNPILIQIPNT